MFKKPYTKVRPGDWQEWAEENDAVILDVREPKEWALGTLPDSELISITEIAARLGELDKSRAILCVCRSGNRSGQVAGFLAHNGFETVANLERGLLGLGMRA